MRKLLSLLMGVSECATPEELRKQFQKLMAGFMEAEMVCGHDQKRRYQAAMNRLTLAYENCKNQLSSEEPLHGSVTGTGLLLGELLIDAGIITQAQLDDALEAQAKQKPPLPLGRIMVARQLLTWEQLAFYLKLQELLQLPPAHQNRLARQLQELGLASRSEMDVAIYDCQTTGCSLLHAINRRAWVNPSVLALLTDTADKSAPKGIGLEAPRTTPNTTSKTFARLS